MLQNREHHMFGRLGLRRQRDSALSVESTTQSEDRLTSLEKVVTTLNITSIGFSNSGVTYGTSRTCVESHMVTSALLEHEFLEAHQTASCGRGQLQEWRVTSR